MENVTRRPVGPVAAPSMVVYPKPLGGERAEHFECFAPGETLGAYVRRVGVTVPSRVLRVEHNGREVPLALWQRLIPRHGDMVVISARGLGGGGGGKILRTVALVAIVVLSYGYGAALGGALGLSGTTAAAVGSSIIMIGGSLLVNALLPMPTPTAAKLGTGQKYESSPTYSIQGGRNRVRSWEPMSLVFGRHKVVPDLGGAPYTQFQGSEQYLNQVFHFGLQGDSLLLSDLKIGNTPITDYRDVQTQMQGTGGKLDMFPGNVDTLQGFTLTKADGYQFRTTPPDTISISVEFAARLFRVRDDGSMASRSVNVRVQYRPVGTFTWTDLGGIDAVYATHYWSGRPLYGEQSQIRMGGTDPGEHFDGEVFSYVDDEGGAHAGVWRWVPHPYALGQPWQGLAPDPMLSAGLPGFLISGARQDPSRLTVSFDVPRGQYELAILKDTDDVNDSRESNETAVNQILVFQQDDADYSGQCRLAMRIKASGQINGAVDEFNAVVSAQCPVWDGSQWITKETSNPGWWFLWFAKGKVRSNGDRVYGGGMSNSQIDVEGVKAWAAWCDEKKLTFNYVLDAKMSTASVLQIIARAGRATPTYQTGRLGVIWDAENLPETAVFGPFNVKAGSFRIAYVNDGMVDEIVASFVNEDNGWVLDEVRAKVPGAIATNNPLQLDLDGVTNLDQAGREANLLAASQVWKRRRVTWETDIEGLMCTRGDVVRFSHDLTEWGHSGRLLPGSGGVLMKLQNKVPSAGTGTALLRDPEGNLKIVSVVSAVGEVDELEIVSDLDGFPMPGDPGYEDLVAMDWTYQFDPLQTPGRRFKITSVAPAGDGLRFEAMDDDPEYYDSENDPYQYTPPRDGAQLAGVVLSLTWFEQIVSVAADQSRVTFNWVLTRDMDSQVLIAVNGQQRLADMVPGRSADVVAATGDTVVVTVTPRSSVGSGVPKSVTMVVQGLGAPLPAVTGLQSVFRDGLTVLVWSRVVDIRQPSYEIRLGPSWADGAVVGTTDGLEALAIGNGLYWVAARFRMSNGTVIYGPPASLLIAGATLERNVLVTKVEQPEWTGVRTGGVTVYDEMLTLAPAGDLLGVPDVLALPDVLWVGGSTSAGEYTTAEGNTVDIGYVTPVRLDILVEFHARNLDDDILSVSDIFAVADVLGGSNRQFVSVVPQIRSAQVSGAWDGWRDYVPGLINARYFQVRLKLSTQDPNIVPFVERFEWTVDVPDLIQHAEGVSVPIGGLVVDYVKDFHAKPNVQITIAGGQEGDTIKLTAETVSGFSLSITNNGAPVARQVNWIAQGY
jgi:predicted phage tail protein